MIRSLARVLTRMADWLAPSPSPSMSGVTSPGRLRGPTTWDLLAELKSTAWTCASLNAAVCAANPPRLYVATRRGQPAARCLTRSLAPSALHRLRSLTHLEPFTRAVEHIEEVTEHPLLTLLAQVNPVHNAFDLWELTTLAQEVIGCAYWLLEPGPLGVPDRIWPLASHLVTPFREPDSPHLVDAYLYRAGNRVERFSPDQIIAFRYPDPREPYLAGLSPLRACYDQAKLMSDTTFFRRTRFENHALPDAIISPEEAIGEDERQRLETAWNQKLRGNGAGRVLVADSALRVQLLSQSMGDLAALANDRATREDICNAFHVPVAFLTTHTNLANLQAAEQQHASQAIRPRLRRRDEKLNEQLVPLFDPTGRLFLAADDPVSSNRDLNLKEREVYLRLGVLSVNEVRSELGLPPV